MAWIEQIQRDLGGPVVAFALQNWIFLLVAGVIGIVWLVGAGQGQGAISVWFGFGGDSNSDDDGGGDGGGGDGGGGGD